MNQYGLEGQEEIGDRLEEGWKRLQADAEDAGLDDILEAVPANKADVFFGYTIGISSIQRTVKPLADQAKFFSAMTLVMTGIAVAEAGMLVWLLMGQ